MTTTDLSYDRYLRMVHKAVYAFDRKADRLLAERMNGTFSQFLVMTAVANCRGLSQQKIAEFLDITPAAVSRHIDSLVKAGYSKREIDPSSRRSHVITLTPSGEERYRAMHRLLLDSFKESVSVSTRELDTCSDILEKMLSSLAPECAEPITQRS